MIGNFNVKSINCQLTGKGNPTLKSTYDNGVSVLTGSSNFNVKMGPVSRLVIATLTCNEYYQSTVTSDFYVI